MDNGGEILNSKILNSKQIRMPKLQISKSLGF